MTLLERLKELAKSDKRREDEPFIVWLDRIGDENCWIREQLPLLLELAEEAKAVYLIAKENDIHHIKLGNLLAKLEGGEGE